MSLSLRTAGEVANQQLRVCRRPGSIGRHGRARCLPCDVVCTAGFHDRDVQRWIDHQLRPSAAILDVVDRGAR